MKKIILFLFLLTGIVCLRLFFSQAFDSWKDGENFSATVRLSETPKIKDGRQIFDIEIDGKDTVRVVSSRFPRFWYGENLSITGKVSASVLADEKIVYSTYFPKIEKNEHDVFFTLTGGIRQSVEILYRKYLPPTSAELLLGVVMGGKTGMNESFVNDLQTSGVMHVVAASGMNVTFLAGFLLTVTSRLFARKKAIIFSMVAIVWYTFLAGLEPSIVRAGIMAVLSFTAVLLGRQQTGALTLYITACLMLIINPTLLSDVGFHLSLAATAGILFIKPLLTFKKLEGLEILKEDFSATFAAQITTLPLLILYFESIGIFSVIVNAAVLWMIPILMILGSLAAFVGLLVPFLGSIIALTAYPFLWLFEMIITVSSPYHPTISVAYLPLSLVLGYYLVVASVLFWINTSKKNHEVSFHH